MSGEFIIKRVTSMISDIEIRVNKNRPLRDLRFVTKLLLHRSEPKGLIIWDHYPEEEKHAMFIFNFSSKFYVLRSYDHKGVFQTDLSNYKVFKVYHDSIYRGTVTEVVTDD